MQRAYVRELKPYSVIALSKLFGCSISETKSLIGKLMMRGIIRYRTGRESDPEETDVENAAPDERYQFRFVGLVMFGDIVLVAYPKYFRDRVPDDNEIALIMRVLKRDSGFVAVPYFEKGGTETNDKLPVMLALLELYDEHGIYTNYVETRTINGNGPIDWNRTINRHLPVISNNCPVYTEFETRVSFQDDSDYITRIHRAVLTECSRELHDSGVNKLLTLNDVYLSDESVGDLGDPKILEWRLTSERSKQFIDWKIQTLDLLERYLLRREAEVKHDEIEALGTTSFQHVWEVVCGAAFGNMLGYHLGSLGFTLRGNWTKRDSDTLLDIIPAPKWERATNEGYVGCGNVKTLIPDTVSFATADDEKRTFCIYDAKYYVPSLSGRIKHQPGLDSITKQYLYQNVYIDFALDHGFSSIVNTFLVPGDTGEPKLMARVSFTDAIFPQTISTVSKRKKLPLSEYIYMWMLPAAEIYDAYLNGKILDTSPFLSIKTSNVEDDGLDQPTG